jgi:hypothetical protein
VAFTFSRASVPVTAAARAGPFFVAVLAAGPAGPPASSVFRPTREQDDRCAAGAVQGCCGAVSGGRSATCRRKASKWSRGFRRDFASAVYVIGFPRKKRMRDG